jgi:hypothetical protein
MISDGDSEQSGAADPRPSQRETASPTPEAVGRVRVTPPAIVHQTPAPIEHRSADQPRARLGDADAIGQARASANAGVANPSTTIEPSRWTDLGGWPRWWVLAGFWLVQAVVIIVLWPIAFVFSWRGDWQRAGEFFKDFGDRDYWLCVLPSVAVISLIQAMFVWPVRRPAFGRGGLPARLSLAVAGLCAAMLAVGILMAVREIPWLIERSLSSRTGAPGSINSQDAWPMPLSLAFFAMIGVGWIIATPLLFAFVKTPAREKPLGRLAALMFTGTIVEVAAIIPIDVLVRKKSSCYCSQGSIWALTICGGVGTVFLGPAIWLPLLAKRRKRWYTGHCDACGYDMSGCMKAERCPECGTGWKPAASAS